MIEPKKVIETIPADTVHTFLGLDSLILLIYINNTISNIHPVQNAIPMIHHTSPHTSIFLYILFAYKFNLDNKKNPGEMRSLRSDVCEIQGFNILMDQLQKLMDLMLKVRRDVGCYLLCCVWVELEFVLVYDRQ